MTSIVIAYRDMGDVYRRRNFDYVLEYYAILGWEIVVEAGASDETFTRSRAINAGVERAGGDVIVQADPDNLVPLDTLLIAEAMAAAAPGLVFPHDRYVRLSPEATEDLVEHRCLRLSEIDVGRHCEADGHGPNAVGGVVVFGRETWERAGRFDESFGLWGGDDAAFAYAAAAFCAPARRLTGDVTHLWHPRLPQSNPETFAYVEQFAILAEYRDAATIGPEAVRELVGRKLGR